MEQNGAKRKGELDTNLLYQLDGQVYISVKAFCKGPTAISSGSRK